MPIPTMPKFKRWDFIVADNAQIPSVLVVEQESRECVMQLDLSDANAALVQKIAREHNLVGELYLALESTGLEDYNCEEPGKCKITDWGKCTPCLVRDAMYEAREVEAI